MAVCGFLVTALLWLGLCSVNRAAMGKEQKENERAIRKSRQELSEQSAVSMNSRILTYKTFAQTIFHTVTVFHALMLNDIYVEIVFSGRLHTFFSFALCSN